jgi:hypothetical protein
VPLQNILPAALESILRQSPLSDGKIAFAWRAAVGPGVARVSRARLAGNSRLEVVAIDARWQREIRRSLAIIRPRLDALLGPDVIKGIDITIESSRESL